MIKGKYAGFLSALCLLVACSDEPQMSKVPSAIALTKEAAGHYCQMVILDHPGPKAQMFLENLMHPLWFSQVRDGLAKVKSKERNAEILVLYVNDMGVAKSWEEPGIDNWIRADQAFFVVGSDAIGGMGAPEYVPFSDQAKALAFISRHGGKVVRFEEISAEAVLSPIDATFPRADKQEES